MLALLRRNLLAAPVFPNTLVSEQLSLYLAFVLNREVLERILLTVDLDFGYLLAVSRAKLPSVILFRLGNESYEIINECLAEVLNRFGSDLATGVIISVSDRDFRVRQLPI